MVAAAKYIAFDAWENRRPGRQASLGEIRSRIRAHPIDAADHTQFTVEVCHNFQRQEMSFTLFGKASGYPEHPLCRYDVQSGRHGNPPWFPPQVIPHRALHRHVYNERAIREDLPWDACALVCAPDALTYDQAIGRLPPVFLQECNIEIHDPDVKSGLFGRGTNAD